MSATLVAHNPRFNSNLVTLAQLKALPMPPSLGPVHKPVPHADLVECILETASKRGLNVIQETYALGGDGANIFGVLDFEGYADRSTALGFRNAVDQSMSLQAVAGSHVFVCDNLAFNGEFTAWAHKNTTGLELGKMVSAGFDVFARQVDDFDCSIERLQAARISDDAAKVKMWDVFSAGILPIRLVDDADQNYFRPDETWTDCTPRTQWGVFGALTRAARVLSPTRLADATVGLGKAFGIGALN